MTGPELLANLRTRGVTVTAEAGKLRVSARSGVITEELREMLAGQKPALLAALTGEPVPSYVPGIVWDPRGGVRLAEPPASEDKPGAVPAAKEHRDEVRTAPQRPPPRPAAAPGSETRPPSPGAVPTRALHPGRRHCLRSACAGA